MKTSMVYYIRHLYHSPFSEISVLDGKKEGTFLSFIFYQLVNYYGFQSFSSIIQKSYKICENTVHIFQSHQVNRTGVFIGPILATGAICLTLSIYTQEKLEIS